MRTQYEELIVDNATALVLTRHGKKPKQISGVGSGQSAGWNQHGFPAVSGGTASNARILLKLIEGKLPFIHHFCRCLFLPRHHVPIEPGIMMCSD